MCARVCVCASVPACVCVCVCMSVFRALVLACSKEYIATSYISVLSNYFIHAIDDDDDDDDNNSNNALYLMSRVAQAVCSQSPKPFIGDAPPLPPRGVERDRSECAG